MSLTQFFTVLFNSMFEKISLYFYAIKKLSFFSQILKKIKYKNYIRELF